MFSCANENHRKAHKNSKKETADLTIGVMPITDCLPFYVAGYSRIFEKEGVKVKLITYKSSLECGAAIRQAKIDGAYLTLPELIFLDGQGVKLKAVMGMDGKMTLVTNRTKRIKKLSSMKERTIAISRHDTSDFLLDEIAETVGKNHIAAISFGGAPMDFSFEKNVGAILHMYLGGQAVGESVADLISGEVNPSGKLAETIPFSEKDTPAWRYFAPPNDDVEYRESIFVGYRYYETFHVPVKYPFGYGLSYTSFSYSELNVPEVYSGGKIQIRFKIKNIGKVSGAEIAQLYICPIESDVIRSHIELKGFQKIYLHPGEEKEVILELDERSFSVYDVEKKAFSMLSGKYQICIGASVHDLQLKANMEVVGNSYFRNERELFPDYFREQPHGMEISAEQFYQLLGGEPKHDKEKKRGEYTVYDSYQDVVNVSMFGKFVRGVVHIGLKIILRGKSERDPAFKMVKMGVEEGNLEGLIATSGGIATPKLIDMLVYNANKKYLQAFKRLLKK